MSKLAIAAAVSVIVVLCCSPRGIAQTAPEANTQPQPQAYDASLLTPPTKGGPVVVRVGFRVEDIDEVNEENETFEFTGVLSLAWQDERLAFDPAAEGLKEKVYQGDYQFNELSPSWFPQVVLVNSSGQVEQQGVVLRGLPDGNQILLSKITAVAKTKLDLRWFPFDRQNLKAVFEVLGFDNREVILKAHEAVPLSDVWLPQWRIAKFDMFTLYRVATHSKNGSEASTFVASFSVERISFYIVRLVVLPLLVIVLLSFSVFWMDRLSLGDRINVSFIGILTAVAYQLLMNEIMPRIDYATWIDGFLSVSFLLMVGAAVVNLAVGRLEQDGRVEVAHSIDHVCRWLFPVTYFLLVLIWSAAIFLYF